MLPYPTGHVVALDTETSGLAAYRGDKIFVVGYATDHGEVGCMPFDDKCRAWIRKLWADPKKTLVFHNAKFDLSMFDAAGFGMKPAGTVACTLLLSSLFNEDERHNLKYLSRKYLDRPSSLKDAVDDWLKANRRAFVKDHGRKPNFSDVPLSLIRDRVVWDAESCLLLYHFFKPHIDRICPALYEHELEAMFECIEMEKYGEMVDITRAKKLRRQALRGAELILNHLTKLVLPITVRDKDNKVVEVIGRNSEKFNPNSNRHLEAAFGKLGIELRYRTAKFNWSFDEDSMVKYCHPALHRILRSSGEDGWPFSKYYREIMETVAAQKLPLNVVFVPLVLKYRELIKMVSTYYDHLIHECTDVRKIFHNGKTIEAGIIHCSYNPFRAKTGRMSSSKPNKQNMPRLMGPRECFIPRPGKVNVHFDYDQVEMKFFVHFAKDPKMAEAIANDIHRAVAAEIYSIAPTKVTDEQRKRAKAVNFGIIYGAGGPKIAETLTSKWLPTSRQEGAALVQAYHRRFPAVHTLINNLKREIVRNGYITNPYGRRYRIPVSKSYVAINYLCQGTSADLMKRGLVRCAKLIRKGYDARILATIHDEIVVEMSPYEVEELCPLLIAEMEELTKFLVPITVGVDLVTVRWSKKEDFSADRFRR